MTTQDRRYAQGARNLTAQLKANPMKRGPALPQPRSLNALVQSAPSPTMKPSLATLMTPAPSLGVQREDAIDGAFAARNANHVMPKVGVSQGNGFMGAPGKVKLHDGSRTLQDLFPSAIDAPRQELFEAAKQRKADQRETALGMRQQRAQYRNAKGDYRSSPMFDSEGGLDMLATVNAQQMGRNPQLTMAALMGQGALRQADERLAQSADVRSEPIGARQSNARQPRNADREHALARYAQRRE